MSDNTQTNHPPPSPLLTAADVARVLKIDRHQVYDLVAKGRIPHVRISPNRLRFDPLKLSKWIEQRTLDGSLSRKNGGAR